MGHLTLNLMPLLSVKTQGKWKGRIEDNPGLVALTCYGLQPTINF